MSGKALLLVLGVLTVSVVTFVFFADEIEAWRWRRRKRAATWEPYTETDPLTGEMGIGVRLVHGDEEFEVFELTTLPVGHTLIERDEAEQAAYERAAELNRERAEKRKGRRRKR